MRADDDEAECLKCGSRWFRLTGPEDDMEPAVTLDRRGVVTGFVGEPVCHECDEPWRTPAERRAAFRVVS